MTPDILIHVRCKTPDEGGRTSPGQGDDSPCPCIVDGESFECRLMLDARCLSLGNTYELPATFFDPERVIPLLATGKQFILWEGKEGATGTVVWIIPEDEIANRKCA